MISEVMLNTQKGEYEELCFDAFLYCKYGLLWSCIEDLNFSMLILCILLNHIHVDMLEFT